MEINYWFLATGSNLLTWGHFGEVEAIPDFVDSEDRRRDK